jgi:hypothetical protein
MAQQDLNAFADAYTNLAKINQYDAQQTAGNKLATGDFSGATNTLYRAGDIAGGQQVQQYSDTQRVQHAQAAQRISQGIRAAVQAGHTPAEAYDMATQIAPQLGVDPADLAKMRPAFDKDPRGFLDMVDQQAKHTLQVVNRGNGGYDVVDLSANGNVVRAAPGRSEPKVIGGYVYMPQDGSQSSPAAQPAPTAAPNADAVWQAMKQRESRGNGNAVSPAGAVGSTQMLPATAQAMAQKLGVVWRPDLMKGNSPQALQYQDELGRAYFDEGVQKYGGDLSKGASYYHGGPNEAIWGPKTRAYAQAVTGQVAAASGQNPPMQGGAGQDALAAAPQIPGYQLLGAARPAKPAAVGGSTKDQDTTVDPNIVKGLIEGRIAPPTQKAATTPYWQAQLAAATAQDPTFDGINFQARAKTRSDFTSGKSAQNITALNTVIGHLDHLDRTINELGNTGPGGALNFGPLNALNNRAAQAMAGASGTDARYKNFETAKTAVANELTRVFRGTGGAEADIQGWMKQLDGAGSPEALHKVVQSMAELINSRIEALGEQYQQGMGTTKDPITLLTPDKQKAFTRLMGGSSASQGSPPQAAAAPAGWSVKRVR